MDQAFLNEIISQKNIKDNNKYIQKKKNKTNEEEDKEEKEEEKEKEEK